MQDHELYTLHEVAEILRVSYITVRRMIKDGRLPVIRMGRLMRIYKYDIPTFTRTRKGHPENEDNPYGSVDPENKGVPTLNESIEKEKC